MGWGYRIWSCCIIFINGVPCESNSYFGLYNSINTYVAMGKDSPSSLGTKYVLQRYSCNNW